MSSPAQTTFRDMAKSNVDSATQEKRSQIVSDSLAMGVVFALAVTVLSRIVGFGRGLLFCRLMSDQQLGQWSMVWSMIMLLAPLAVLGLPGCFGRFTEHYRSRGQLKTFFKRIVWISSIATLTLSAGILMLPETVSWFVFRDASHGNTMIWLGIALVTVSGMNFLTSFVESLRQVRLVTIMRFILSVGFTVVGCGLMLVWSNGAAAATVGYGVACLLAAIPAIWFLTRNREAISDEGETLAHSAMWKRIAPFAVWLWLSNLFHNLFEVADRYMLIHWSPVEASLAQGYVGQYHSGRVVPLLLVSVAAMLGGLLMPYLSAAWEQDNRDGAQKQLNWSVKLVSLCFTVGGLVVLLGAPLMFDGLLQGRYNDGLAVLPLTFVYCIWFSMFTIAQDYLWVAEKGKLPLIAVTLGLVANILLNVALIPTFGLWGAVYATAIANLLNIIAILIFNHIHGCKSDVGLWLCIVIPGALLAPIPVAAAMLAIVAVAGYTTNLLFSIEEKAELQVALAGGLDKLKSKLGR